VFKFLLVIIELLTEVTPGVEIVLWGWERLIGQLVRQLLGDFLFEGLNFLSLGFFAPLGQGSELCDEALEVLVQHEQVVELLARLLC
jgi:hypothetical protein